MTVREGQVAGMQVFTDTATSAIEWALRAQTERQRVSAHNIANVNTPGFRSERLDFEENLAEALAGDRLERARWTIRGAGTPVGLNGNDVSLEEETEILMESGIHYDALVQALNFKLGYIRSAIGRP